MREYNEKFYSVSVQTGSFHMQILSSLASFGCCGVNMGMEFDWSFDTDTYF